MVTNIEIAAMLIMALGLPIIILLAYMIMKLRDQTKRFNNFLEEILDANKSGNRDG